MSGLECKDCFLKFSTAEELANHKEKFCTESDWYDDKSKTPTYQIRRFCLVLSLGKDWR